MKYEGPVVICLVAPNDWVFPAHRYRLRARASNVRIVVYVCLRTCDLAQGGAGSRAPRSRGAAKTGPTYTVRLTRSGGEEREFEVQPDMAKFVTGGPAMQTFSMEIINLCSEEGDDGGRDDDDGNGDDDDASKNFASTTTGKRPARASPSGRSRCVKRLSEDES